jgi:FtsH-binding integral membrane protein
MWNPQTPNQSFPLEYSGGMTDTAIAKFFNAVYAWMAVGLAVTASVAWYVSTKPAALAGIYHPGAMIGLVIAQLVLVVIISSTIRAISASAATALFLIYAGLNGLMLASIFLIYTLSSVAGAFIACAAMFAVMSIYGMFTKTNLTTMGKIMFMALIGLIVASIVNFFFASSGLYWLISYAGVIIFAGLTAYDTQRLQIIANSTRGDAAMSARMSVVGALTLYLDFINMFLFLLRIFGNQQRR